MFVLHLTDMPSAELNHLPCPVPFKGMLAAYAVILSFCMSVMAFF